MKQQNGVKGMAEKESLLAAGMFIISLGTVLLAQNSIKTGIVLVAVGLGVVFARGWLKGKRWL